jgi:hypothetical protein
MSKTYFWMILCSLQSWTQELRKRHFESSAGGSNISLSLSSSSTLKKSTKVIGDVGYVFRKEFNEGWFTGIVVKIMEDGDQRCEYWTVMLKTYFWMILCSLLNWIQIIAPWNQGEARYCTRGTQM